MNTKVIDLIDFEKVNTLLEGFNQSTGMVTAILDLEGNILSKSGWRKICTDFHRIHPETSKRCTHSDTVLASQLSNDEKYHFYKCLNGLVDVAVPVIIKGEHIANLFSGQFFFEAPNYTFFKKQAAHFGFDEAAYLEALDKVPIISEEEAKTIMQFLLNMTQLISEMTFQRMELLELNKSISESEETYRMLYDSLNDAIFTSEVSEDGSSWKLIYVNDVACERLGYTREELLSKNPGDITTDKDQQLYSRVKSIITQNQTLFETEHITKDGRLIPVEVSTNTAYFKGRRLIHSVARDITERKRVERIIKEKAEEIEAQNEEYLQVNEELNQINEELQLAKDRAEESDRLKTAFLQNMSHEIRTPMNAIMGFSELLLENANDKSKLKSFTDIINLRCHDLLDIINDLLDISKIESGQLPVHIEEVNLKDLFAELSSFFSEYQKRINKQHIHFSLNAFSIPGENLVLTDKVKLKQIFINLISNAFKFTDEGKIEGGCKFDQKRNLLFWVSDTGIGIPPDKHQFIFERFTQLHQGVKKNIGGTGLGLSIVKALVNLLGGNIYLESVPGKGCTFYFSIPYNPASIESTQPLADEIPKPVVFPDKTVMIVEDDPYNAEYLKEVLSNTGLNILLAETGKEAVSKLLEEAVDLVLMDIRLPDISGYEVAQVVREQKSNLRIIAQTAYATSDEHKKALNAGFVDYLSKPIRRDVLLSMLNKHLTN